MLKALTEADDSEVTENLKKIQERDPEETNAHTIAIELAGAEASTCNLGEGVTFGLFVSAAVQC